MIRSSCCRDCDCVSTGREETSTHHSDLDLAVTTRQRRPTSAPASESMRPLMTSEMTTMTPPRDVDVSDVTSSMTSRPRHRHHHCTHTHTHTLSSITTSSLHHDNQPTYGDALRLGSKRSNHSLHFA